jgi:hypothetical protein
MLHSRDFAHDDFIAQTEVVQAGLANENFHALLLELAQVLLSLQLFNGSFAIIGSQLDSCVPEYQGFRLRLKFSEEAKEVGHYDRANLVVTSPQSPRTDEHDFGL